MHCTQKRSFPLKISSVNEEILNGKLHFLCSDANVFQKYVFS